jgi:hypothetical protein
MKASLPRACKTRVVHYLLSSTTILMCCQVFAILPIGQFQVELHVEWLGNLNTLPKVLKWWERLEARGMRLVWTEPNLLGVTMHINDGMPRYVEVSSSPW